MSIPPIKSLYFDFDETLDGKLIKRRRALTQSFKTLKRDPTPHVRKNSFECIKCKRIWIIQDDEKMENKLCFLCYKAERARKLALEKDGPKSN